MDTVEENIESKGSKKKDYKSWVYIISFLVFFFLVGFLVKWLSSDSHGLH